MLINENVHWDKVARYMEEEVETCVRVALFTLLLAETQSERATGRMIQRCIS